MLQNGYDVNNINSTWTWDSFSQTQSFLPVPTNTDKQYNPSKSTRIACMSDTHGKHRKIPIPKSDILIHAGDFTRSGEESTILDLADYFVEAVEKGKAKKVICISGNHDISFDNECCFKHWDKFHPSSNLRMSSKSQDLMLASMNAKKYLQDRCVYLEDESLSYENNSINFYGSPWTPTYGNCWAFMKDRDIIHSKWDQIPTDTDVLITHGPPLGRGDKAIGNIRAGCFNLLQQVQHRVKPRVHVFGHIHEGNGVSFDGNTLFCNASNCTIRYRTDNPCTVIDVPHDRTKPASIVTPNCPFTGTEILEWLKKHEYDKIYPYFEHRKPLLNGSDLVQDGLEIDDLAALLKMHSLQVPNRAPIRWNELREELIWAMMNLRCQSY